jgi:hypothetical protein
VRNGTEACDGPDLGGNSCLGFGYYAGTPTCRSTCGGFDKTGCSGYCGDGVVSGGEFCDGRDQHGDDCAVYSRYTDGALGCDASCRRTFETCGEPWTAMASGTWEVLWGVWGTSGREAFAVGDNGTILHYGGSTWSAMDAGTSAHLEGVWGSSGNDVFAVGADGSIQHYDGSAWGAMDSGTTAYLAGVWGTSGSDVFAVGEGGTILHYDGSTWSSMTSGTTQILLAVWGTSGQDVFAVGGDGTILHFDGSTWSAMTSGTTLALYGVGGTSGSDVFAVAFGTILRVRSRLPEPYGGACASPILLYCAASPDPYYGTSSVGRTAAFDSYGSAAACPGARPTTGTEVFYRLDCPVTGTVTVRLTPAEADLDLIIIGEDPADSERGCDPTRCIATSQQDGLAIEEVTFASTRDARYYAVVDGYAGAVSGYTLEIVCAKQ